LPSATLAKGNGTFSLSRNGECSQCRMPNEDDQTPSEHGLHLHRFQEELGALLTKYRNRDSKTDLVLTFKSGSVVHARELSVFLDLFTVAYNFGIVAFDQAKESAGAVLVDREFIDSGLMKVASSDDKAGFLDLEMERISFQRYLSITLTGITTALILAVVLSGAETEEEPRGLSAYMGTLDHAIAHLKRALNDQ